MQSDTSTQRLTVIGALTIGAIVALTYFPGLRVGFYADDWKYQESIGRLGPVEFVARSFDPTEPSFLNTYRPFQGLLLALEYPLFGTNPVGYRSVHIALHLLNSLMLGAVVWALTRNPTVAFLSGILFGSLPIYSLSVFLPSATDVLATFFYLGAIWLWLIYLRNNSRRALVLTHVAFIFGLLSKESVATLPVILFLTDWLFFNKQHDPASLLRRYFPIAVILMIFVIYELNVIPTTYNYYSYGTSIGPHIIVNAIGYVSMLVFPWNANIPNVWLWLSAFFLLFVYFTIRTRNPLLPFIAAWSILNILPVLGFREKYDARFLYLAGIASAMLLALLIHAGWQYLKRLSLSTVLCSGAVGLVLLANANGVADMAQWELNEARDQGTLFRAIARQHPTLPPDTRLYVIDIPAFLPEFSGMFYVRYGKGISVAGNGQNAELQKHANTLLYHFDPTGRPIQIEVQKQAITNASPQLPVTFDKLIRLEDYELSSSSIRRGTEAALFLSWRGLDRITKDYTVFVHLVHGTSSVAGIDSQPVRGSEPTTTWNPGALIVDALVFTIPTDIEAGADYHLEVGLYYLPTMERLSVADESGHVLSDHILIEPVVIQ